LALISPTAIGKLKLMVHVYLEKEEERGSGLGGCGTSASEFQIPSGVTAFPIYLAEAHRKKETFWMTHVIKF
jgi:hypothetical protein